MQVETRSMSTVKARHSKGKASGKMRRSRPRDKESRRPTKSGDQGCQTTHRSTKRRTKCDHGKSTKEQVYGATMAINNRFESKSSTEQRTSKGGMTVSKMHPTNKYSSPPGCRLLRHAPRCLYNNVLPTYWKPTGMQSTQKCTKKSTEKSTSKSTKPTKNLLKRPIESAHWWSRPDGHRTRLWSTIPESSSIWKSMPLTDDYRLGDILRSTARRLKRAQAHLNLVSTTILEKLND